MVFIILLSCAFFLNPYKKYFIYLDFPGHLRVPNAPPFLGFRLPTRRFRDAHVDKSSCCSYDFFNIRKRSLAPMSFRTNGLAHPCDLVERDSCLVRFSHSYCEILDSKKMQLHYKILLLLLLSGGLLSLRLRLLSLSLSLWLLSLSLWLLGGGFLGLHCLGTRTVQDGSAL